MALSLLLLVLMKLYLKDYRFLFLSMLTSYVAIELDYRVEHFRSQQSPTVELYGVPTPEQSSIDLAMYVFNVKTTKACSWPRFDPELEDRGLTHRGQTDRITQVDIGPSAFHSWALLGATLIHELEGHCFQDHIAINILDAMGLPGTVWAEYQAYSLELRSADRVGLSVPDKNTIAFTRSYFLPEQTYNITIVAWLRSRILG